MTQVTDIKMNTFQSGSKVHEWRDGILNNGAQVTLPKNPFVGVPFLCAFKSGSLDRAIFLIAFESVAIAKAPREDIYRRLDGFGVFARQCYLEYRT